MRLTARRPALSSLRTRAQAGVKLAAGAAAATQLTAALPALAVIEERMGGEGAGAYGRLPLGINDPILGFILAGVVRRARQHRPEEGWRERHAATRRVEKKGVVSLQSSGTGKRGAHLLLVIGRSPSDAALIALQVVTVWGLYLTQGGNAGYEEEDSGLDL